MSYYQTILKCVFVLSLFVATSTVAAPKDYDDYMNKLTTEEYKPTPIRDPAGGNNSASAASSKDFSVVSKKINRRPAIARNITLISPVHRATYTTGMLTFSWKPKKKLKSTAKYLLTIESLDGSKKITKKMTREQKDLALDIGEYKWQVTAENGFESSWRHFKIIDMDAKNGPQVRDPSSIIAKAAPDFTSEPDTDADDEAAVDTSETDLTDGPTQKATDPVATSHASKTPLQPPRWVHIR